MRYPTSEKTVLSIAGSDPFGGAGIQADMKVCHHFGVYGMGVITCLTAQNSHGIHSIKPVDCDYVREQIEVIFEDVTPDAVKIGALGSHEVIEVLLEVLKDYQNPIVLDTIFSGQRGGEFLSFESLNSFKRLIGRATLITPNINELEWLTQTRELAEAVEKLRALGVENALVTGGHSDDAEWVSDYLFYGNESKVFQNKRIMTDRTHGTGCALSSAIAANLVRGDGLLESVERSIKYVHQAILTHEEIGSHYGPINHRAEWEM